MNKFIKNQISILKPSATLAINEESSRLEKNGKKVYKFGFGQSPFPIPENVILELKNKSLDDIIDMYKNNKINFNYKKRFNSSLSKLIEKEKICNIKISDFIVSNIKKKKFQSIIIGEKNYQILRIKPKTWFGFQGVSKNKSLIMSCTTLVHLKKEILRKKVKGLKYKW